MLPPAKHISYICYKLCCCLWGASVTQELSNGGPQVSTHTQGLNNFMSGPGTHAFSRMLEIKQMSTLLPNCPLSSSCTVQ